MSPEFSSVDSSRQTWENRVNASFLRIKSEERVCFHANCTVSIRNDALHTECDYCPAWTVTTSGHPEVPPPRYFRDPDPFFL